MNLARLVLVLMLAGCASSRAVTGGTGDAGGGDPSDPGLTDAAIDANRDAYGDAATDAAFADGMPVRDAELRDALTLRITDEQLRPIAARAVILSRSGSRVVSGDRVGLTSQDLAERVDVLFSADGFATFGLSGFTRDGYTALPTLEGEPAVALLPVVVTEPLRLLLTRDGPTSGPVRGYVHTIPVGYGVGDVEWGGVHRPWLQRDAAVEALVVSSEGPCGRRLPVTDLTSVRRDPLELDLDDPGFVDLSCTRRPLVVRDPSGSRLRRAEVRFQRRGPSPLVMSSAVDRVGEQRAGGQAAARPAVDFLTLDLVVPAEASARREHPAVGAFGGVRVEGVFGLGDGTEARTFLVFPSFAAIPDAVRLPEPTVDRAPRVLGVAGHLDARSRTRLATWPEAVSIDVSPSDARWPVLTVGRATVLLPPGARDLRLRRLLEALLALPGDPLIDFDPRYNQERVVLRMARVTFEPVASTESTDDAGWEDVGGFTRPFVVIQRDLFVP